MKLLLVLLFSQFILANDVVSNGKCYNNLQYKMCKSSYAFARKLRDGCPKIISSFPGLVKEYIYYRNIHQVESSYPGLSNFTNSLGLGIFDAVNCVDSVKFPIWQGKGPEGRFSECLGSAQRPCSNSKGKTKSTSGTSAGTK